MQHRPNMFFEKLEYDVSTVIGLYVCIMLYIVCLFSSCVFILAIASEPIRSLVKEKVHCT